MTKAMRLFGILAVAALVVAAASPVFAGCTPGKSMGQLSDINVPQATLWPGAVSDSATGQMIGRFWSPGTSRSVVSEGAYSVDRWLFDATLVGLPAGTIVYGFLGEGDVTGCPSNALITVIGSPQSDGDGASFVVGKVTEWFVGGALDFDYTRTSTETAGWVGKTIPKPAISATKQPGTRILDITLQGTPDVAPLFYGEPGMLPTEAIVARRLYQFIGPGAPGTQRSPATSAWTYANQRFTGVVGGGPATLPAVNCDTLGAGNDIFFAWALEFEGGLVSDFVGKSQQVVCNSGLAAPGKFKNIDKRQGPKNK